MILIRRIVLSIFTVFGATAGFIILGLINLIFSIHLSFSQVFLYGMVGGMCIGFVMGWVVMIALLRYFKKKLMMRLGNLGFLSQVLFSKRKF